MIFFLNGSRLLISAQYCKIVYNSRSLRETRHWKSAALIVLKRSELSLQLYSKEERKGRNWIEMWADCINLYVAAQTAYVLACYHLITHTLAPPSCCAPLNCILSLCLVSFMLLLLQASSSSSSSPPGSSFQSPVPSPVSQPSAITRVCSPSGDLMTITSLQHFNKSLNARRFQCPKHDVVDLPSPGIYKVNAILTCCDSLIPAAKGGG